MPTELAQKPGPLKIAKFEKALHNRSAFSCGHDPIDNFLKNSLSEQVRSGMIAAWMATAPADKSVLGFYTLGAMAIRAEYGPKAWSRQRIKDIPAIYIRAVAVRLDTQGRGVGRALMIDAMKRCVKVADQMGAAAIVLDVFHGDEFDRRWKFYADLGFQDLKDPGNPGRVFIPMQNVRASLR